MASDRLLIGSHQCQPGPVRAGQVDQRCGQIAEGVVTLLHPRGTGRGAGPGRRRCRSGQKSRPVGLDGRSDRGTARHLVRDRRSRPGHHASSHPVHAVGRCPRLGYRRPSTCVGSHRQHHCPSPADSIGKRRWHRGHGTGFPGDPVGADPRRRSRLVADRTSPHRDEPAPERGNGPNGRSRERRARRLRPPGDVVGRGEEFHRRVIAGARADRLRGPHHHDSEEEAGRSPCRANRLGASLDRSEDGRLARRLGPASPWIDQHVRLPGDTGGDRQVGTFACHQRRRPARRTGGAGRQRDFAPVHAVGGPPQALGGGAPADRHEGRRLGPVGGDAHGPHDRVTTATWRAGGHRKRMRRLAPTGPVRRDP